MAGPSLTHVSMWNADGWRHTTADYIARIHPGGSVKADSGLFMCELCGEYVTFVSSKKVTSYFKHKKAEADKYCPERTSGSNYQYEPRKFELPIRLIRKSSSEFSLELGLLAVPQHILESQDIQHVEIQCRGGVTSHYVYSFDRLNENSITYVNIGNHPAENYYIKSNSKLVEYWPSHVQGITGGAIFDGRTWKKLPPDADVVVGRTYYLLTSGYHSFRYSGIQAKEICRQLAGIPQWKIYEITASNMSRDAAEFFMRYRCRLSKIDFDMQPIWPVYVQTPYVIKHGEDEIWMYINTTQEIKTKVFPDVKSQRYFSCANGKSYVARIQCNGRQQMISLGRSNVLRYTYFWVEKLDGVKKLPVVTVTDVAGNMLQEESMDTFPDKGVARIHAAYDGTVILKENEQIVGRYELKANTDFLVDSLKRGITLVVLQGLDIVWQTTFEKAQVNYESGDQKLNYTEEDLRLYQLLNRCHGTEITISHSIGAVAQKLQSYPKVKGWVYQRIKSGTMPEKAYKILRDYVVKH